MVYCKCYQRNDIIMSVDMTMRAYAGKNSKEFKKHFNAVKFCIKNELSYPKETSEFFKGKVDGGDLEDHQEGFLLDEIKNGIEIDFHFEDGGHEIRIKTSDIPKEVDEIVITLQ